VSCWAALCSVTHCHVYLTCTSAAHSNNNQHTTTTRVRWTGCNNRYQNMQQQIPKHPLGFSRRSVLGQQALGFNTIFLPTGAGIDSSSR
jgi:hypothetical protein